MSGPRSTELYAGAGARSDASEAARVDLCDLAAPQHAPHVEVGAAVLDAMGTAVGFAIALLILGGVREILGYGTLMREMDLLFGPAASSWVIDLTSSALLPLALFPPGAFLLAGLLFALVQGLAKFQAPPTRESSVTATKTVDYKR